MTKNSLRITRLHVSLNCERLRLNRNSLIESLTI